MNSGILLLCIFLFFAQNRLCVFFIIILNHIIKLKYFVIKIDLILMCLIRLYMKVNSLTFCYRIVLLNRR